MATARLSVRALNRALLSRQFLLKRHDLPERDAVEHLIGLHAQIPAGPYVGLWSRLRGYRPERLSTMVAERELVRTALMRSTIHLVTPDDCLALRPLVQPVLDRDLYSNSSHSSVVKDLDLDAVIKLGLKLLDERPRTPSELGKALHERWPDRKPDTLAYAVRNLAALVQIPPRGTWGGAGRTVHASARTWLGRPLDPDPSIERMIRRYLAAFGPASVADVQAWCGLTKLAEIVGRMELRTYLDEDGRELFDVPELDLPDPAVPARPRYLPEFDNVFLSHARRERIIPDGVSFGEWSRRHGVLRAVRGGALRGNLLVGGLLQGIWRVDAEKKAYKLVVEPFTKVSKTDLGALESEGHGLLAFAFPQGESFDVQVVL
ncbi:winged helix DNA-binding domain-containing protein [Lentzea sp. NPDC051838]|uniref:winged helix DNA-binding domain-containing protein n=1 Tax=Lentzea sp. NPDC051838 TaxID=3154849 RepID=UPI00341E4294